MLDKKIIPLFVIIGLVIGFLAGFYYPREPIIKEVVVEIDSSSTFSKAPPFDWKDPNLPRPSTPLKYYEIPQGAVRLMISAEKGFEPSSFQVKAGEQVIIALTAKDNAPHVLAFEDESLSDVAVGVGNQEIKAITFYAPEVPGEYNFFCDVPKHPERGETGKMIVVGD